MPELVRSDQPGSARVYGVLQTPAAFPLIVIAASAGGIEALVELLPLLPAGLPAFIVIALHLCPSARYQSVLDQVLGRAAHLTVKWAEDREPLLPSVVYLAPQDHHTIIDFDLVLKVYCGPRVNRHQPAADLLFCSAAKHFGANSIAVVLSGSSSDGAEGSIALAKVGARVLVQDAESSRFGEMPAAVRSRLIAHTIANPARLGRIIAKLVKHGPERYASHR